jgi:hypothetical protein
MGKVWDAYMTMGMDGVPDGMKGSAVLKEYVKATPHRRMKLDFVQVL